MIPKDRVNDGSDETANAKVNIPDIAPHGGDKRGEMESVQTPQDPLTRQIKG